MPGKIRKDEDVHFGVDIPDCDVQALMSKKYKWRKDWAYCYSLEKLVAEECEGFTLNLCCGFSSFGDVRADIDPQCHPQVICDIRHLPFQDGSFETVFVDPPYCYMNRPGFIKRIFDLARRRVIIEDLPIDWKAGKRWERKYAMLTRTTGFILKWAAIYTKNCETLDGSTRPEMIQK